MSADQKGSFVSRVALGRLTRTTLAVGIMVRYFWKKLVTRGIWVCKERLRKLMQRHGIKARAKRKFVVTTDSKHKLPIAPNLLERNFSPEASNQVWASDITDIDRRRWPLRVLLVRANRPFSRCCFAFKRRSKGASCWTAKPPGWANVVASSRAGGAYAALWRLQTGEC